MHINSSSSMSDAPVISEDVEGEEDEQHVYDPVAKEDDEDDDDDNEEEDPYDHVSDDKLYDKVASGEDDDDNDSDYESVTSHLDFTETSLHRSMSICIALVILSGHKLSQKVVLNTMCCAREWGSKSL